jgi:hypothetical protein
MANRPVALVEMPEFSRRAERLMSQDELDDLKDFLARHPTAGDLIAGLGGCRKLRWRLQGRGKRGGARVIYVFFSVNFPLFLLDLYAKNEKSDLSSQDRSYLRQLLKTLP